MIDDNLSAAQKLIIRRICQFQLESLKRILEDKAHSAIDIKLFLIQNEVTQEDFEKTILSDMERYKSLLNDPDDLRALDEECLSHFRHLLTNIKEKYKVKYPNAIKNLWSRLFLLEEHKSLGLSHCSLN